MPDQPNDRLSNEMGALSNEDPRIYVVVGGKKFPRPALETFFVDVPPGAKDGHRDGCSCHPVAATYCSCNKVCTCVPACSCVGHTSCSCDSHSSSGGTVVGCRCAPVH